MQKTKAEELQKQIVALNGTVITLSKAFKTAVLEVEKKRAADFVWLRDHVQKLTNRIEDLERRNPIKLNHKERDEILQNAATIILSQTQCEYLGKRYTYDSPALFQSEVGSKELPERKKVKSEVEKGNIK